MRYNITRNNSWCKTPAHTRDTKAKHPLQLIAPLEVTYMFRRMLNGYPNHQN